MMNIGRYDATRALAHRLLRFVSYRYAYKRAKAYSRFENAPELPSLARRGCWLISVLIPKRTDGHARYLTNCEPGFSEKKGS